MMEPTNQERAERFQTLLRLYDTDDTDGGCLTDLLADARHWCDHHEQSYWDYDDRAHQHYLAEVSEARRAP